MVGVKRKISEVDGGEIEAIPSVKDLASSEPKLRRHCLQTVLSHLDARSPTSYLNPTQALQLWRGFHVALYMHDSKSAISVQNLITQLAGTFSIIRSKDEEQDQSSADDHHSQPDDETADDDDNHEEKSPDQTLSLHSDKTWLSTWSTAFWQTMIREWSNIDQHRMNKYLLLIRTVVREIFTICFNFQLGSSLSSTTEEKSTAKESSSSKKPSKKPKSNPSSSSPSTPVSTSISTSNPTTPLQSTITLLQTYPLQPRDSKIPNGLRLHMLDIYVDELFISASIASSGSDDKEEKKDFLKESLESLMTPINSIAQDGLAKNVRTRAKEEIGEFERRFGEWLN